jgi:Mg2+ and Co2+ transporter CorA
MGCIDNSFCPTLFIPHVIDWGIEDPKGKQIEKIREISDDIDRVWQFAAELTKIIRRLTSNQKKFIDQYFNDITVEKVSSEKEHGT